MVEAADLHSSKQQFQERSGIPAWNHRGFSRVCGIAGIGAPHAGTALAGEVGMFSHHIKAPCRHTVGLAMCFARFVGICRSKDYAHVLIHPAIQQSLLESCLQNHCLVAQPSPCTAGHCPPWHVRSDALVWKTWHAKSLEPAMPRIF